LTISVITLIVVTVKPRSLQDELKMTRPFKSLEEEALLSIARPAAGIEHQF
jgi:hypothetical protein